MFSSVFEKKGLKFSESKKSIGNQNGMDHDPYGLAFKSGGILSKKKFSQEFDPNVNISHKRSTSWNTIQNSSIESIYS